ncbi:MAG: acyl-CoA thioesterase [Bdellovibrionota bacterium]
MKFEIHRYPLTILEGHLDTFGHVNNAKYLEILEEARWDFITSRGFGLKKIQESGKGPIILEIKMKFLKEIKVRQNIIISESQTISMDRLVATLRQHILNEAGEVMFEAESCIWILRYASAQIDSSYRRMATGHRNYEVSFSFSVES